MDIKYLYGYLQQIDDYDERVNFVADRGEMFRKCSVSEFIEFLKFFNDGDMANFFREMIKYLKFKCNDGEHLRILEEFDICERYDIFLILNDYGIVPYSSDGMIAVLNLMGDDEDRCNVCLQFSGLSVRSQKDIVETFANIFDTFEQFSKACKQFNTDSVLINRFRDTFMMKTYHICIGGYIIPYVQIGYKESFHIDKCNYVISNNGSEIDIYHNGVKMVSLKQSYNVTITL